MIEVPVTIVLWNGERSFAWDCPYDGKRMTSGKHGIVAGCTHKAVLIPKTFDAMVARVSHGPLTDPTDGNRK